MQASTRYSSGEPRSVNLIIPIYDMCNHDQRCTNYNRMGVGVNPEFMLMAGSDIAKGDEVRTGQAYWWGVGWEGGGGWRAQF